MSEKYRAVRHPNGFLVANTRTGKLVTGFIKDPDKAEATLDAIREGRTQYLKDKSVLDFPALMAEDKNQKAMVYVVLGSTFTTYQMDMEDRGDEDWETFSSPQVIGVFSLPGLALEAGIHSLMTELRESEFSENEEGGPYLPGTSPLDGFKWVDDNDQPYDDNCPLKTKLRGEEFGWANQLDPEAQARALEPCGRPSYVAYLREEGENPPKTEHYHACVVVQEMELDKQYE